MCLSVDMKRTEKSHYQSDVFVCVSTISRGCGRSAFNCFCSVNVFGFSDAINVFRPFMYSHYLSKAIKLVKVVYLQVYKFNLSFVRIWGWVSRVWEILTLLGFKKTYQILDNP